MEMWLRRGCLKHPERAVRKVRACYGGRVELLADVCRHRLVFETPQLLLTSLRRIQMDPETRVVRVKGLSSANFRIASGNGFRGLVVKLCLSTERTRAYHADQHICEIQLILKPFAHLLQDCEMHARYLHYRDQRLHIRAAQAFWAVLSLRCLRPRSSQVLPTYSISPHSGSPSRTISVPSRLPSSPSRAASVPSSHETLTFSRSSSAADVARTVSAPTHANATSSHVLNPRSGYDDVVPLAAPAMLSPAESAASPRREAWADDPPAHRLAALSRAIRGTGPALPPGGPPPDDSEDGGECEVAHQGGGHEGGGVAQPPGEETDHLPRQEIAQELDHLSPRRDVGMAGGSLTSAAMLQELGTKGEATMISEAEVRETVEGMLQTSAGRAGGQLSAMIQDYRAGLHRSNINSMFFTSEPAASALSKRRFQGISLLWCIYFVYFAVLFSTSIGKYTVILPGQANQTLRFTWLPDGPSASPALADLGLLSGQCKQGLADVRLVGSNSSWLLHFSWPPPRDALVGGKSTKLPDGYYFRAASCPADGCPSRWVLEALDFAAGTWVTVGGSYWRYDSGSGMPIIMSWFPYVGRVDESEIRIEHECGWKWYMDFLGTSIVCAVGWAAMTAFAVAGREKLAVKAWEWYVLTVACNYFVLAIANHVEGNVRAAVMDWCWVVTMLWLGLNVIIAQRHLIYILLFFGVLQSLLKFVEANIFGPTPIPRMLNSVFMSSGMIVILTCLVLLAFRRRVLRLSRLLVRKDKEHYDLVWAQVVRTAQADHGLEKLTLLLKDAVLDCGASLSMLSRQSQADSADPPEENGRTLSNSARHNINSGISIYPFFESRWTEVRQGADGLDQLYMQAYCVNSILLYHVKAWARVSRGMFPVAAAESICHSFHTEESVGHMEFALWSDLENDPARASRVVWPKIKSVQRAVEKIVRSYKQDVSRLLDVCRHCIVFESVADLRAGIETMLADKDVLVVRVKNRLDLAYSSSRSAGYRDVCINLRLDNELTQSLGLDSHICEVQLVLLPFAQLKSDEGHKRYVQFRDMRGE